MLHSRAFLHGAVRILCGLVSVRELWRRTRKRDVAFSWSSNYGSPWVITGSCDHFTSHDIDALRGKSLTCHNLLPVGLRAVLLATLMAACFASKAVPGFDCYQNKENMPNLTFSSGQHRGTSVMVRDVRRAPCPANMPDGFVLMNTVAPGPGVYVLC